jgi:hypothetical protein
VFLCLPPFDKPGNSCCSRLRKSKATSLSMACYLAQRKCSRRRKERGKEKERERERERGTEEEAFTLSLQLLLSLSLGNASLRQLLPSYFIPVAA